MKFKQYLIESKESREAMKRMNLDYIGWGHYKDNSNNIYVWNAHLKKMLKKEIVKEIKPVNKTFITSIIKEKLKKYPKIKNVQYVGSLSKFESGNDVDLKLDIEEDEWREADEIVFDFINDIKKTVGSSKRLEDLKIDVFINNRKSVSWNYFLMWLFYEDLDLIPNEKLEDFNFFGDGDPEFRKDKDYTLYRILNRNRDDAIRLLKRIKYKIPNTMEAKLNKIENIIVTMGGGYTFAYGYWNKNIAGLDIEKNRDKGVLSTEEEELLFKVRSGFEIFARESFIKQSISIKGGSRVYRTAYIKRGEQEKKVDMYVIKMLLNKGYLKKANEEEVLEFGRKRFKYILTSKGEEYK